MSRLLALVLLAAPALFAEVERGVMPGAAGPNRLDVDVALLSRATSDLRDLRFFDEEKREVGYLLVAPRSTEPQWLDGRVLPVAATKTTSGFEVDLGSTAHVDRLRLDGIPAPFLKRLRVEGSGDRARWTLLADATVFDLPDEDLRLLEVPFAAGSYRYLRATWDDRSSARVTSVRGASARMHGSGAAPEPLRVSVPFRKRASEPGRSRYRIDLPGPHLPLTAIELRVANGNVYRDATITEPRLGNGEVIPATLGSGTLRRAERWGAVAEAMSVRIAAPAGRELDLVIEDGSNPPLAITAVVAQFAPQPWIYFESPSAQPLTARYGNERLAAPRYDLEASRGYLENAQLASARWSKAESAATTAPPAAGAVAALQGAPVDRGAFRVARAIPNAPAGLAVLVLDADVLARSRDLQDVRIVTADDRQIPYLVEKRGEPLVVPVALERADSPKGTSAYRFELPFESLPSGSRLVLETSTRVFERTVTLRHAAEEGRGRIPMALETAPWRATDPELLPPALAFNVPRSGPRLLELVVEEGDNATLQISGARLLLPSAALRFHHPGTPLVLLYGNREAGAPRYDLSLLAPRLFGEPARELTLAPIGPPAEERVGLTEQRFFWMAMVAAAVVLLALLTRLLVPRAVSG